MSTIEQMEDAERTARALVRYYQADEFDAAGALTDTLSREEMETLIAILVSVIAEEFEYEESE